MLFKSNPGLASASWPGLFLLVAVFVGHGAALAQEDPYGIDELAAEEEIAAIKLRLEEADLDSDYLTDANARAGRIDIDATGCVSAASDERARLEERFEPLRDVDPELATSQIMDQRADVREELDQAIAAQDRCVGIVDDATSLQEQITARLNELSQEFLTNRSQSVFTLVREFPDRAALWPSKLRSTYELRLIDGLTPADVLWMLIAGGLLAGAGGLLLRQRFASWYGKGGGDAAAAQVKYLLPKPIAEFAPLWLIGAAFVAVLTLTIDGPTIDMPLLRVAWAIFGFGLANVVINWATGPLSPSSDVDGLIPDHVKPLRLRLRLLFLAIALSFVVLGAEWLAIRVTATYVSGRASMIFLVAIAFMLVLTYLGRIPGVKGRYRLLRWLAIVTTALSIVAILAGYQNLAAFLIHGITRTMLALFLLWILLWVVFVMFEYLIRQETPAANTARASLGITKTGSGTALGFMRLIADVVLWVGFIVYMIYVWDDSGTTLSHLRDNFVNGIPLGSDFRLVPIKFIGGILIFVGILIVIGWMKRWIDRRWLQHIVVERGARDAIITLFGYVGFVVAVLIALTMADVDLTGLALVSGALALGIGFGMQEIANNFVSGLILLFERPIRAGDFVSVGDVDGFVRSIRIRATEIETLDNQNVLVPNSELVSGRVTNWVLRDTYGRLLVNVGVAYGSDVEKVRDILERVAREHPEVITDGRAPAPRALFMGFGDSSLDFELRVRVQRIERRFSVKSELNFAIDQAFAEAGITIPFPQRDLHIVSYPDQTAESNKSETDSAPDSRAGVEPVTRSHEAEVHVAVDLVKTWDAVTNIDALKQWVARDGNFGTDLGSQFDLALRDGYELAGIIDVCVPERRLRAIITPKGENQPLASGPITLEISLRKVGDKTRIRVTIAGIPDSEDWEEYYRLSVDRWNNALAELKIYLLRN